MTLVTSGDDLMQMADFLSSHPGYTAAQAVDYLCSNVTAPR